MGAKAVFASQTLALYVSAPEIDALLKDGGLVMPLYLGKARVPTDGVVLLLGSDAQMTLAEYLRLNRQSWEEARQEHGVVPKRVAANKRRERIRRGK